MYSRSAERIPAALPEHYGGNAFRPDGTPTPIPVRRETPVSFRPAPPLKIPEKVIEESGAQEENEPNQKIDTVSDRPEETVTASPADESTAVLSAPEERTEEVTSAAKEEEQSFLGRLTGGLLPGLREDDLLILLLLYLLSSENGNGDILLLLAALLLLG